jgi:predicted  nucleic acid-binding Zn-ribbon protein
MTDELQEYVAICAACGYQWNESAESTFNLNCPTCGANLCHKHDPDKDAKMGEDFDGVPWY